MARVIVTRAWPEADETAARLRALGHQPIVSPALETVSRPALIKRAGLQALLFSSAAAARALAKETDLKTVPVLAVGDATAAAARAAGFADVRSAQGAGAALLGLAKQTLSPAGGQIVHAAGEDVAVDLAEALRAAGFAAARVSVYRALVAQTLSEAALAALAGRAPAAAASLFHSARGGESFAALARAAGVEAATVHMAALCLSARVATAVKSLQWKAILVAPEPREEALLSLLGAATGERP